MDIQHIDRMAFSIYSSVLRHDEPRQWLTVQGAHSNRTIMATWNKLQLHIGNSATIDIVIEDVGNDYRSAVEAAIIRYTASIPMIRRVSATHIRVLAQGLGCAPEVLH